jgi:hypothetical protein
VGVEGYHDLWPRGGVAYRRVRQRQDVVKVNIGRYLEAAQNGGFFSALNPTTGCRRRPRARGPIRTCNFRPDCDLLNRGAELTASGGDICGANTNANFGTEVFESTLDPALLSGWGVRSGDWQWGASIQQEVLPRVAVEVGYQRRWLVNFLVTDNRARRPRITPCSASSFPATHACRVAVAAYLDGTLQRDADGGGAVNDNFQTLATIYGDTRRRADSINMNVTARPRRVWCCRVGSTWARPPAIAAISGRCCRRRRPPIRGAIPPRGGSSG